LGRRSAELGADVGLVVEGVALGDQAPTGQARRRPARAAEKPVDALPAVAEREVEIAEALRCRAVEGTEDAGAAADILAAHRDRRPPAALGQQAHFGVERLVLVAAVA